MIILKSVRFKNFLAVGREWIQIDLSSHKTTLIMGSNGAGKSTLLDALSFVLFNKPFRDVNKGQVVNAITKKDCVVECEMQINGNKFLVRRGIKPNIFEIWINGVQVPSDANAVDFQTYLEKSVLKLNHKSFTQVVMLGSALFVPFMKLKAAQRREVVEDLLDLQVFSRMNVLLKSEVQDIDSNINDFKGRASLLEQMITVIEKSNAALRQNNDGEIANRLEIIDREQRVMASNQILIDQYQAELDKIPAIDSAPIIKKRDKIKDLLIQANTKLKQKLDNIQFFDHNTVCPTCNQEIAEHHKHTITDELATTSTDIKNVMSEMINKRDQLAAEIGIAEQRAADRKDITDQIWSLQNQAKYQIQQIQQYNVDIERLRKPPAAVQTTTQEYKELGDLRADLEVLQQERRVASYALLLLKDSGIKSQVIKQYVPIFNTLINKYLTSLDFFVDFNLDENFNETIRSRHRDEFTYNLFSEGQKMRIDLAIMFTWRAIARQRNSIDINILVMDEIFESALDDSGTDEIIGLITKMTKDDNVFVISPKGQRLPTDKFDRVIKFDLVKNFSQMELV